MKTVLTALLLLVVGTSFAQQLTGSHELTLDDAVKMALDKNYNIRTAGYSLETAQLTRSKAGDALLPSVSGSADYTYSKPLTKQYGVLPDASHGFDYGVGANINIFNGGADAANIRSAGYNLDAARYNLKWVRQSIAFNVTSAYIAALRFKELQNSTAKTLAESRTQLDRVKGQFQAGAVAIGLVYQQDALVGQQELEGIQAKNNYENALADLLYLLDVAPNDYLNFDVSLKGIDTTVSAISGRAKDVAPTPSNISSLVERREDFAAIRSNILAQEANISITRSLLLPTLGAGVRIGGSGFNTSFNNIPFSNSLTGTLSLSVPIFDRFQNRTQIDIQKVNLEASQVNLEQSVQSFKSDIAKAQNNLRGSEQALGASASALASAEESLRSATERLRVGAGIQVDVVVAEAQVQTARSNRINSVYNYLLASKQLEYLLGRTNY